MKQVLMIFTVAAFSASAGTVPENKTRITNRVGLPSANFKAVYRSILENIPAFKVSGVRIVQDNDPALRVALERVIKTGKGYHFDRRDGSGRALAWMVGIGILAEIFQADNPLGNISFWVRLPGAGQYAYMACNTSEYKKKLVINECHTMESLNEAVSGRALNWPSVFVLGQERYYVNPDFGPDYWADGNYSSVYLRGGRRSLETTPGNFIGVRDEFYIGDIAAIKSSVAKTKRN